MQKQIQQIQVARWVVINNRVDILHLLFDQIHQIHYAKIDSADTDSADSDSVIKSRFSRFTFRADSVIIFWSRFSRFRDKSRFTFGQKADSLQDKHMNLMSL